MDNKIFQSYGGGKGNILNENLTDKKSKINTGDYVEISYNDITNHYINSFKGIVLQIESYTTDKTRKFYKVKTCDGIFDIKDKFIQSISIIKDSK